MPNAAERLKAMAASIEEACDEVDLEPGTTAPEQASVPMRRVLPVRLGATYADAVRDARDPIYAETRFASRSIRRKHAQTS